MKKEPFQFKSSNIVYRWLTRFLGYLDKQSQVLSLKNNGAETVEDLSLASDNAKGVLLLSPMHYFERYEDYPLERKKELLQVLKHETCQFPECDTLLYRVGPKANGTTRVFFWEYDSAILQFVSSKWWLVLPESFILSLNATLSGSVIRSALSPEYVIEVKERQIQSRTQILNESMNAKVINDYSLMLNSSILNVIPFIGQARNPLWHFSWKKFKTFYLAFVLSAGVISVFDAYQLYNQKVDLEQQLNQVSGELDQAFATQKQYRQAVSDYNELAQALPSDGVYKDAYQQVLLPVYQDKQKHELRVFFHRKQGSVYTFSGSVKDATLLLRQLKANPQVKEARFSSDLQRTKTGERFIIQITLN